MLEFLTDFLESTLSAAGHTDNSLTPEACVERLAELTREGVKDASGSAAVEVQSCLLTTEQRVCQQNIGIFSSFAFLPCSCAVLSFMNCMNNQL